MSEGLKKTTIAGLVWSGLERLSSQGVMFILSIILARLVTPEDYGVLAIVMVFITITGLLVDGGFAQALVRKIDSTDIDRSTVLYYNIIISILMYVLLYVLAPTFAIIYDIDSLTKLIRYSSIVIVINSFSIVQQSILISNIDFKKQTVISLLSSVVSGCIGIYMAYIGYGVWALISQVIISALVRCIALWIIIRWKPLFVFSKKSFDDLFGFSSRLMLSQLVSGVGNEIAQIAFAKIYSTSSLGYYNYSKKMAFFVSSNISSTIQRVLYPAFSKIQNNETLLVKYFNMSLVLTLSVLAPFMFTISILSNNIIELLLTKQWYDASPILQIVAITMAIWPLLLFNKNILDIKKRSDLSLIVEIINTTITLSVIIIFWRFGLLCICLILLFKEISMFFLYAYMVGKVISFSLYSQVKYILPIFVKSALISLMVKVLIISHIDNNLLSIIVGGISVATLYIIISIIFKSHDYKLALELIKKM